MFDFVKSVAYNLNCPTLRFIGGISMEKKERIETKYRLMELMSTLDIKQSDIAEKTGIPKSAISQYVSGKRLPRQDKIAMIADAYGIEPAWIMGYPVPMYRSDASVKRAEEDFALVQKYRKLSDHDKLVIDKMIDSMLESY